MTDEQPTPSLAQEFAELADAATPGEWFLINQRSMAVFAHRNAELYEIPDSAQDADFIAFVGTNRAAIADALAYAEHRAEHEADARDAEVARIARAAIDDLAAEEAR